MKPGWKSTEFYLTLICIIAGALPTSGLVAPGSTVLKIAGLATMVLGALGYTYVRGQVKQAASDGEKGFGALEVMVILCAIGLGIMAACATMAAEAKHDGRAVVDCTTASAKEAVHEFGPTVDALLAQAVDNDGKVNWDPVKDIAKGFTANLGGCVLADTVARFLHPVQLPGAPKSEPLQVDKAALLSGFDALRSAQYGGKTFVTEHGTL